MKSIKRRKSRQSELHPLPKRLSVKKYYVFPSRHGLVFLVILAGMLAGSINYNNNLGFLLVFLLGSIAFVSIFHTARNLDGVQITSADAAPVHAGEKAVFEFRIVAPSTERPAVSWKFPESDTVTLNLSPERENLLRTSIPTRKRGLIRPGVLTVQTFYPLGLFRSWQHFRPDVGCVVYPKPEPVDMKLSTLGEGDEENRESREAGVVDFHGIRNYQPGDSLKRVFWKAYSRGQGLFTKVFEAPSGGGLYLDWDAFGGVDEEKRLSMLCFMILKANAMDMDYGLNLPGRSIEPGKGEKHKRKCLKALALHGCGDS